MPILTGLVFWGKMIIGGSAIGIIGLLIYFSRETGPGAGGLFGFVVIPFIISLIVGGIYILIGNLIGY